MIYPSILDRQYEQYLPFVQDVAKRVKETMLNFCDTNRYAVTWRIKTRESLAEKIETGRFKKWPELDDLFGCTVIIPNLLQEQQVIKFCQDTFQVTKTVKRGQNKKSPDTFKFDSTRIYARLKSVEDTNIDNLLSSYTVILEIQIKSAFEHAWAVSTHDLVYKGSEIDWKKLRLAAQIKAIVEQLDTMILAFEQISPAIQESDYPEIKIKCQIATATLELFERNKIPEEFKPKDMNRFCDNLYGILISAKKKDKVQEVIKSIKTKINETPSKQIPRSISLLQYFLAILVEAEIIILPLDKYYFHITSELLALYPMFEGSVGLSFEYEL